MQLTLYDWSMPTRKTLDIDCSVANAIDLIGDRWSLLILRDAFFGVRRFDDFCEDLGISRNVLTSRLELMAETGVLETRSYQDNPPRHEYRLTEKGRDLFDVLMALWRFGDRWDPSHEERVAIHTECGNPTHAVPTCSSCGEELTIRNIRVDPSLEIVEQRLAKVGR